jgi:mannose-6-phosphate isomerase-like protein (cupin superfamily)
MIIKEQEMKKDTQQNMRGGKGSIELKFLVAPEKMPHGRMIAEITIPVGASIGEHEHVNETEYYIITEGEGTVRDNGTDQPVKAGEVVMTPNGSTHSIENTGSTTLKMIAVIILD